PLEPDGRTLVFDRPAFGEILDHAHRLLEHGERRRRLAEDASRRVAAADTEVESAARQQLQRRERACRDRWLARRGIRDTRAEPHLLRRLRHERERDVWLLPQHVAVEDPPVCKAACLRALRERGGAFQRDVRLQRESEFHERRSLSSLPRSPARRYSNT